MWVSEQENSRQRESQVQRQHRPVCYRKSKVPAVAVGVRQGGREGMLGHKGHC